MTQDGRGMTPKERAERIALMSRQDRYSKAVDFKEGVAAEIRAAVDEAIQRFILEAMDDDPRLADAKAKVRAEAYEDAAKIAIQAVADHDAWMLNRGVGWELKAEQDFISRAIRSRAAEVGK